MADDEDTQADESAAGSLAVRIVRVIVMVVIVLLVAWVFVRLISPAVRPNQKAPKSHVPGTCSWCHAISEKAKPIKVDR